MMENGTNKHLDQCLTRIQGTSRKSVNGLQEICDSPKL